MAKSSYQGSSDNPTSSYKFIKDPYLKEYNFRLANEEAIAKKKEQLAKRIIDNTGKTAQELRDRAIAQADDEYNNRIKNLNSEKAAIIKKLQDEGKTEEEIQHKLQELRNEAYDEYIKRKVKAEEEFAKYQEENTRNANKFAIELAEARYQRLTANQKALYKKEELNEQRSHLLQLKNDKEDLIAAVRLESHKKEELLASLNLAKTEDERKIIQQEIDDCIQRQLKLNQDIVSNTQDQKLLYEAINKTTKEKTSLQNLLIAGQMTYLNAAEREAVIKEQITEEENRQADIRAQMVELAAKGKGDADPEMIKLQDALNESAQKIHDSNLMLAKSYAEPHQINDTADKKLHETLESAIKKGADLKSDNLVKKNILEGSAKKGKGASASTADKIRAQNKENRAAERESNKLDEAEKAKQANEDFGPLLKENIKQSLSAAQAMKAGFKMLDDLAKSIDESIESFYQYQAQINARLQGSNEDFKKISKTIKDNVGFSGIVSQKEVVNNIKQLTDSGVAYNLELRAFLATTKDKIAETFDVFNGNLLRIIRIQQADTTAARLGMEASLTQLFNKYFSDTSYLGDISSGVSEALLEASAQMTRDNSLAFEYIVQKWLGSLYSIGLSQDTVSTIAQGLNYLSTGNVEQLNNNDSMRTLFALSASQAGLDFGELLLEGLDVDKTNLLLKSMVEYLGEIATNISENKVTQSVYADLFGTSRIDLQVFANLKDNAEQIYKSTLSYNEAVTEASTQLTKIASRMHVSQILDTVVQNIKTDVANNIGGNFMTYGLWKTLNIIEGLTGGIDIPAIGVMGNMVDLDTTIMGIAKAGMAGLSFLASMISGLAGGNLFGSLDLQSWGFEEYTARGKNITAINQGMASGVSEASSLAGVGSSSSEDIRTTSLTDATDQAAEDEKITNKDMRDEIDVYTQIRDALYKDENTTALKVMQSIRSRMDQPFITSGSGGGGGGGGGGTSYSGDSPQPTPSTPEPTPSDNNPSTPTGSPSVGSANELESIIKPINSILSELQGIRGRLDQPFTTTGEASSSGNALQTFQEALFGTTLNVKVTNLSELGIIPSNKEGTPENINPVAPTPGTLPTDVSNQINDYTSQLYLTTIIGQLQGIRGRLDQPFASNLVVAQKSFSDLIEETHTNSSLIKDTLLGHDLTEIIKNSNSAFSEMTEKTIQDQNIDAMALLLSLLSFDRVFKAQVISGSQDTPANDPANPNSNENNIHSNINNTTTYIEAIANHTNVLSQLTTAVSDLNTSIVSSISQEFKNSQLVDNISSLQSQVSAIHTALGITKNENIDSKGQVFVNGIADDVKSSLATSFATVLVNALNKSAQEGQGISLSDIQNMLSLMNLNVTVTNDYFSDVLRKEAFNT